MTTDPHTDAPPGLERLVRKPHVTVPVRALRAKISPRCEALSSDKPLLATPMYIIPL